MSGTSPILSARHPEGLELLLTDVVMPHMLGPRLAEALRSGQTRMKVLYVSGYADDEVVRHGLQHGSIAFLQKPFTVPTLLTKVRQVLDASGKQG